MLLIGGGRNYLVRTGDGELHTDVGIFKLDGLLELEFGDTIRSHKDFELKVYRPRASDFFNNLKRTGAPISPKDIGMIMAHTGLNKADTVLDAGTGSGILAIYLGLVAKRVLSYEIREDFAEIARSNLKIAGLDNVEVRSGDLIQEIHSLDERFDVVTLDMHQSAEIVLSALRVLNPGGYLAVFSPFIEQAKEVRMAVDNSGFVEVVTLECIQREMSISKRGTRPSTVRVGHTGYLTFARVP